MSGAVSGIAADGLLEMLDGANRLERPGDDLGGPNAMDLVGELALEQLRVGQDDAELVVQAMKEAHHLDGSGVGLNG
jgi:hypothetical protein